MTVEQAQIIYQIGFPFLTIILLFLISFKQVFRDNHEEKLRDKYAQHLHEMNKTAHNQYVAFLDAIQSNAKNHVNFTEDKFYQINKNFENINKELENAKRELAVFNDELKSLTNENQWLRDKIATNQVSMSRHMNQIAKLKGEKRKLQRMIENG